MAWLLYLKQISPAMYLEIDSSTQLKKHKAT